MPAARRRAIGTPSGRLGYALTSQSPPLTGVRQPTKTPTGIVQTSSIDSTFGPAIHLASWADAAGYHRAGGAFSAALQTQDQT
jgi:hypothetical protein